MEKRVKFQYKETIATIIGEEQFISAAQREIEYQRRQLEKYILEDPFFQVTFEPYECCSHAPNIAKRMAEAGTKAGVGPMAAVAGAIAEAALQAMVKEGATHAIVDNGGDIALFLSHPVVIGIYAGDAGIRATGFLFEEKGCIMGVCTSSGRIGHSISFGCAHAATVIARDVALADAAATALGNLIVEENEDSIIDALANFNVKGTEGALVIVGNHIAMKGNIPPLLESRIEYDLITMG
jgi:ApbE superfamily uncharacterized protein (UPF0280 family)